VTSAGPRSKDPDEGQSRLEPAEPHVPSAWWVFALRLYSALAALFLLVSWTPNFIRDEGDEALTYLAHVHFAEGRPWGLDTLHSSGAFGFLRFDVYHEGTYPLLLAVQSATALFIGLVLGGLFARLRSRTGAVVLLTAVLFSFHQAEDARWFFLLFCVLLCLPDLPRRRTSPAFLAALLFAGLAYHVKGPFMLAVPALAALLAGLELAARRPPLHAALLAGLVPLFGLAAGGTPSELARHFAYVVGSPGGYGELFGQLGPPGEIALFLALAAATLFVVLRAESRRRGSAGLLVFAGCALLLWLLWGSSFVRQDPWHVQRGLFTASAVLLAFAVRDREGVPAGLRDRFARLPGGSRRALAAAATLALCFGLFFGTRYPELLATRKHYENRLRYFLWSKRGLSLIAQHGLERHRALQRGMARRLREKYPLPEGLVAPVGVFGQLWSPLVAHRMPTAQLPLAAAYEIWSPAAVELTNRFLASPAAPRHLVLSDAGRSASNALTLAEHYRTFSTGAWTFLERRAVPLRAVREPVLEARVGWNERVELAPAQQGDLLVARLGLRLSGLGRLVTFLYQPPRVFVAFWTGDVFLGRVSVVRQIAEDGIALASREPRDWDGSSRALHGLRHPLLTDWVAGGPPRVSALEIEGGHAGEWLFPKERWSWYFEPGVDLVLERVSFQETATTGSQEAGP
jgi:hypothetical protein